MKKRHTAVKLCVISVAVMASSLELHYSVPAWAHEPPPPGPSSQPANRGPFSLVNHTGQAVTEKDFLGKFMLVYFGYTHCPDLCPIDLQVMVQAIDILGEQNEKVQPIFITVDPERDTVEVTADYVRRFHPRLIGLTGTREQVAAATKTYRVRRMKFFPLELEDDEKIESGATENSSKYVVDHTASFFLVGPDSSGLVRYAHGITAEEIAEDIQQFIDSEPPQGGLCNRIFRVRSSLHDGLDPGRPSVGNPIGHNQRHEGDRGFVVFSALGKIGAFIKPEY